MSNTTQCNIKKDKKYDVYCGRGQGWSWDPSRCSPGDPGWLGNPVIKDSVCLVCKETHLTGGSTLPCYESYLKDRLGKDSWFKEEFFKLKGKKLGCWCDYLPNCHVSIIIKYLDGDKKESRLF